MDMYLRRILQAHVDAAEERAVQGAQPEAALAVPAYTVMAVICGVQTPDYLTPARTEDLTATERIWLRQLLACELDAAARRLQCSAPNLDEVADMLTRGNGNRFIYANANPRTFPSRVRGQP